MEIETIITSLCVASGLGVTGLISAFFISRSRKRAQIVVENLNKGSERFRSKLGTRCSGEERHYYDKKHRLLPTGYYFGTDGQLYDQYGYLIDVYYWYSILGNDWAEDLLGCPQTSFVGPETLGDQ